jgi:hypothetical protein
MKNRMILIGSILVISMILAACGSNQTTAGPSSVSSTGSDMTGLTVPEKLAIGTLMLENTQQKVSSAEAAELLPLWKAAKSLSSSNTVSTQEMEALYSQIKSTMTADQIKTINSMTYTSADVDKLLSDLGMGIASAPQSTSGTSSVSSGTTGSSQGAPAGGPGMPPDAAGMPMAGVGGEPSSSSGSSQQIVGASGNSSLKIENVNIYIDPLINILKSKVNS